jgi:proton-dependent oligopeptide transporter, POT family
MFILQLPINIIKYTVMSKRTNFPPVFWVANTIEILERFAYYGIYIGFGIYMTYLGYSTEQLGIVQSAFLFFSYFITIFSGVLADRYGFKKMLIVSYLIYLPSILILIITKSYSGILLSMMSIGFAASIFKPLISGTVRSVTDKTNKTLGFGIYYQVVNIGAMFGPLVAGMLRIISWNYVFITTASAIGVMFLLTLLFYKEPVREIEGATVKKKLREISIVLSDRKFTGFLVLIGVFFWLPLWSFINLSAVYIDKYIDTASLYLSLRSVLGGSFINLISRPDVNGIRHIVGEPIATTAYYIIIFQLAVSAISGKFKAMPSFLVGLLSCVIGFLFLGFANFTIASLVFVGIFFFAVGEMAISPRIMEYITWIAPKENAGLYIGTTYLSTGLGGLLSGLTYNPLFGWLERLGHPEYVWYVMSANCILGIIAISVFTRTLGEFKELEA